MGFYKVSNDILKLEPIKDIDKIQFNHYLMRKENWQRKLGDLPRGQFYLTKRIVAEDLRWNDKKAFNMIKLFEDLGIIKCIFKSSKKGVPSIYEYCSAVEKSKEGVKEMKSKKEIKKITLCDDTKELLDKLFPMVSIDEFEIGLSSYKDHQVYNAIYDLKSSDGINNPIGFIIHKIKENVNNEQKLIG